MSAAPDLAPPVTEPANCVALPTSPSTWAQTLAVDLPAYVEDPWVGYRAVDQVMVVGDPCRGRFVHYYTYLRYAGSGGDLRYALASLIDGAGKLLSYPDADPYLGYNIRKFAFLDDGRWASTIEFSDLKMRDASLQSLWDLPLGPQLSQCQVNFDRGTSNLLLACYDGTEHVFDLDGRELTTPAPAPTQPPYDVTAVDGTLEVRSHDGKELFTASLPFDAHQEPAGVDVTWNGRIFVWATDSLVDQNTRTHVLRFDPL